MIGTNTHVDAANTLPSMHIPSQAELHTQHTVSASDDIARNVQVLSPKDADLYRAAFTAQEKKDWKSADIALDNLTDKCLVGHVLADRYQRRTATAAELHDWLEAYAKLPEAGEIYNQAERLHAKGVKFQKPIVSETWSSSGSYGMSLGFKAETNDDNEPSAASKAFAAKIDHTMHKSDPLVVKALLDTEQKKRAIPAKEVAQVNGRIATALFYEGQVAGARNFSSVAAKGQNPLGLWINGLAAWKQNDLQAASQSFTKLASVQGLSSWDRAAANFWAYRVTKRLGQNDQARNYLEAAAKQPRSFYGFLASQLLGRSVAWSWDLPELNAKNVELLANQPTGWRALALVQVGQYRMAERELHHINPQGNRDLQEAMLSLAERGHMPALAMQLGGMATDTSGKRYDAALYPVPPWQPEEGFQVDRALVYALMRRESQFDPTAVSYQGACGLMQIMPATANLIADDNVTASGSCSQRLMNPSFNIALGQKYVMRLAGVPGIGDNLLLILAAYNSGPGKMAHWADGNAGDPLFFLESMPVRETRDYVQHVLIHYWSYRARLSEPQTSLAQLAHGEWPRVAMNEETAKSRRADNIGFIPASYEIASGAR
ncbi:MAG TPA: lytic transglycosylase domain-containing protein [Alphaproteobacteria bacterium]|nr:lytic transglycosylase domain-containing protein [Alphaproteobacteria bacterium]